VPTASTCHSERVGRGHGHRISRREQREYAFQKTPRCTAKSKRTGERCKAPAVRGWNVCRFHGARGGAPKGKANGAWKHGHYSEAAKAERLIVKLLLKDASSRRKLLSKGET
jgi:hypothetical protein